MRSHPGRIVTIYDVPSLVAEAQLYSLTIRNIQNGFRVSGIHPYNRNVFTDEDFAPAEVTNSPDMGIFDCASDINDQQDSRIQNISDPDELSEQESSNSTGQKFPNFKQTSTSQPTMLCRAHAGTYGTHTDLAAGAAVAPLGLPHEFYNFQTVYENCSFKIIKKVSLFACFNF